MAGDDYECAREHGGGECEGEWECCGTDYWIRGAGGGRQCDTGRAAAFAVSMGRSSLGRYGVTAGEVPFRACCSISIGIYTSSNDSVAD